MRKVFLSSMLLQKARPTKYISDDYDLVQADFTFPFTYIIAAEAADGDEIVIITATMTAPLATQDALDNNDAYKKEINRALQEKNVKLSFIDIPLEKDYDALTFNRFFKQIANLIKDDDRLYADITFGIKPYSFSMFIAITYAVKAARNVSLETVIYARKYDGTEVPDKVNTSKICDLTSLFSLNLLVSSAREGQKQGLDDLLDFIID